VVAYPGGPEGPFGCERRYSGEAHGDFATTRIASHLRIGEERELEACGLS
jgi:hypothetical protein